MTPIRVALGEVHSAILRDILAQITSLQPDMALVGQVGRTGLKQAVADCQADVLICELGPGELPQVCEELFSAKAPPLIVGLAREGREAAICIPNAGALQLTSVIRTAISGGRADSNVMELTPSSGVLAAAEVTGPYTSNSELLHDQLRVLDLALLAGVEALESTIWDESVQRFQGLAISPDDVRALLKRSSLDTSQRYNEELRRRHFRLAERAARRIAASFGQADAPPFVRLVERFELGPFERFVIIAALALEIDSGKYGKAYALLQDDATRKQPSLELLVRLYEGLGEANWWEAASAFESSRPLRRWNLIRLAPRDAGEPAALLSRRIELDDRIARLLLGLDDLGAQMDEFAAAGHWEPQALRVPAPETEEGRLARLLGDVKSGAPGAPPHLVVHVHGRSGTGRRSLVAAVCRTHRLRVLRVDARRLAALAGAAFEESLLLLVRESMLQPTALCLENVDALLEEDSAATHGWRAIANVLEGLSPVSFVIGENPWSPEGIFQEGVFHEIRLDAPRAGEARRIWFAELAGEDLHPDVGGPALAAEELAGRFTLSPGQIHDAVAAARTRALWQASGRLPLTLTDLYRGCRDQCSHRLGRLTNQVITTFGWDDLVLPPKQLSQLKELETSIRNSSGVLEDWNFRSRLAYGRGITAVFSGPSGTGKTMAAGILARELGLDLYKIDLSRVVSKYIGETEKNLERIFQQAEDANAMLFFDEADALFGKRSAIKDAHDRYANIEISYLLQKMEERLGVTILATNLKTNMDEAFVRRIRFSVEFPMPEYAQRLEIWRGSLPKEARLTDDVDLPLLARRMRVAGGSIMNVVVSAASLAYEPGGAIAMKHFLHAAKRELEKLGQQYNETDFTPQENAAAPAA